MIYNHETDQWSDTEGNLFIKNEFDPYEPCFIEQTEYVWRAVWKGAVHLIDWAETSLPTDTIFPIKHFTDARLKSSEVAATYISVIKGLLLRLDRCWPSKCSKFSDLGLDEFSVIWDGLTSHNRSTFRQLYILIAESNKFDVDNNIAVKIKKWKARSNVKTLKYVIEWNPKSGSLSSAELELLRHKLLEKPRFESGKDIMMRILCGAMIELIKRPQQFMSIKADGVRRIEKNGISEYFLEVPKSKFQTGMPSELWPISTRLANEISRAGERSDVKALQDKYNRLFIWESKSLVHGSQIPSATVLYTIKDFVRRMNIHSPRTKDKLHVTPYRLRHTGATRMAMQGVSRDVIQHILEHDDSSSAQAYIDAIGSDLVPAMERADRNLGNLFQELNDIFFKGKVVPELGKSKVFIPIFNAILMPVGSCGKDSLNQGSCKKQPFIACYDGCSNFLAWKEADHTKSLEYVEIELERWSRAEGHNERSKAIKDYERLHHAITEVIRKIQAIESDAIS